MVFDNFYHDFKKAWIQFSVKDSNWSGLIIIKEALFCSILCEKYVLICFLSKWRCIWNLKNGSGIALTYQIMALRQWGFQQCLPLSWTTLRDRHCLIAVMGVVDTFGLRYVCIKKVLHIFTCIFFKNSASQNACVEQ